MRASVKGRRFIVTIVTDGRNSRHNRGISGDDDGVDALLRSSPIDTHRHQSGSCRERTRLC